MLSASALTSSTVEMGTRNRASSKGLGPTAPLAPDGIYRKPRGNDCFYRTDICFVTSLLMTRNMSSFKNAPPTPHHHHPPAPALAPATSPAPNLAKDFGLRPAAGGGFNCALAPGLEDEGSKMRRIPNDAGESDFHDVFQLLG